MVIQLVSVCRHGHPASLSLSAWSPASWSQFAGMVIQPVSVCRHGHPASLSLSAWSPASLSLSAWSSSQSQFVGMVTRQPVSVCRHGHPPLVCLSAWSSSQSQLAGISLQPAILHPWSILVYEIHQNVLFLSKLNVGNKASMGSSLDLPKGVLQS